ncbi:auxin-responsive protein SAUR24-like [Aristolochia californica]|uniref:auxin-responsive protein SAUR24-like n=1 Tax=Aristolochia californica TaxID=171875 RepID=UPI0035E39C05
MPDYDPFLKSLPGKQTEAVADLPEGEKMKAKKGWLAVAVGLEEEGDGRKQRFTIPISYLYYPQFRELLEKAQDVYGFPAEGPLRLPCSVEDFLHLRRIIEREEANEQHLAVPLQLKKALNQSPDTPEASSICLN